MRTKKIRIIMKNLDSYKSFMKSPYNSIKHSTYFDSYDHFFGDFRDKEITFVEIGVLAGGSLFMWRDYFGPKARIIGIDFNPNAKKWEDDGFEIFIGSQSDEKFWNKFKKKVGKIDILLDDGGHTYEQQIVTTEAILDSINDGGLLVIEDTHSSYMKNYGQQKYSFIEYTKQKIDQINMRFKDISGHKRETRFWSIEIVESMVAFKINKKASTLKSELISNNGINDHAEDYVYRNTKISSKLNNFFNRINISTKNKLVKKIIRKCEKTSTIRKFSSKKYFK